VWVNGDSVDAIQAAWQRERPEVDVSSIGIITRLWRLAHHLDVARAQTLAALGTDASTLDALATLRRSGPPYRLTAGQMQRRSLVTAGAISQRLDKLEEAGLVRRQRDSNDRRIIHICLTPRGRRLIDRVFAAIMEQEQQLLGSLTGPERDRLEPLLKRWLSTFEHSGGP
jgi:DNA-binding MarR family transcriptional regulator